MCIRDSCVSVRIANSYAQPIRDQLQNCKFTLGKFAQIADVYKRQEYQSANPTGESWETDCSGLSEEMCIRDSNQLLQLLHAFLDGFHSCPDSVGLFADRGKGCVQLIKGRDTMLGQIVDRCRYGFQFIGCVLLLPTLRILPALFSLNAQILHQQICKVGSLRRLLRGGFPHFEQVGNCLLYTSCSRFSSHR